MIRAVASINLLACEPWPLITLFPPPQTLPPHYPLSCYAFATPDCSAPLPRLPAEPCALLPACACSALHPGPVPSWPYIYIDCCSLYRPQSRSTEVGTGAGPYRSRHWSIKSGQPCQYPPPKYSAKYSGMQACSTLTHRKGALSPVIAKHTCLLPDHLCLQCPPFRPLNL